MRGGSRPIIPGPGQVLLTDASRLIDVPVTAASDSFNAILDTGSLRNVISQSCVNRLRLNPYPIKENLKLRVVDGKCVTPKSQVSFPINIGSISYFITAIIVPNFSFNLLLGMNFMQEFGVQIDFKTGEVLIGDTIVYLPRTFKGEQRKSLRAVHDTYIKPYSEKMIPLSGPIRSDLLFIEPIISAFDRYGVHVARTLTSNTSGVVYARIANLSNHRAIIPRNAKLARGFDVLDIATIGPEAPGIESLYSTHEIEDEDYFPFHASNTQEKSDEELLKEFDINKKLPPSDIVQICRLLRRYIDVMSRGDLDVGCTKLVKHHIETPGAEPIRLPPFRKSFVERGELNNITQDLKAKDIIRDSNSPWASPVVLVRKRDGSWRFCVDWRKLNKVTKKDSSPIPRIDDTLDRLSDARYFTKIDLTSGYYQVELDEESKEKTAFVTPDGHYEFNRLGMGLCNAPATFQRLMYKVLGNLMWKHSMAYLDDIVIFSKSFDDHLLHIEQVLQKLREAGLKLKPRKCSIGQQRLQYLGHIVDSQGVRPDPANIEALTNYPVPTNVKKVQQFLGICGYYRRFIPDFSDISKPLTLLTAKKAEWLWSKECQQAFEKLRSYLLSYPLLRHPNFKKPFMIYTDASAYGVGAILKQLDDQGKEVVVSYASRTLSKPEQNYSATERECLAIIFAVKKFRPYHYGTKFTVVTDHCSLCWLMKVANPNGRLTRWALCLQDFEYDIIYKNGRKHLDADALSRNPIDRCPADEMLLTSVIENDAQESDDQEPLLVMTAEEIESLRNLQCQENWSNQLINCIENPQASHPRNIKRSARCFEMKDGLLHRNLWTDSGKKLVLCVPRSKREEILETFHNHPTAGHLGIRKTWNKIKNRYFWPKYHAQVINYVQSCPQCNQRKTDTQAPVGTLQPLPPAYKPFERVGLDKLGPLPQSIDGNKYIFVVTDYCTRTVIAKATPNGTAAEATKFFLHDVILKFSAPKTIITDRGTEFCNELFKSVTEYFNSIHRRTTAYHPRTNGLTERFNKTLADMMSHYVSESHDDWDRFLPFLVHAYNTAVHDTLGYSPSELLFGFNPDELSDVAYDTPGNNPDLNKTPLLDIVMYREKAREIAVQRLQKSQESAAIRFDSNRRITEEAYEVGDLVWIRFPKRPTGTQTRKLKYQYNGPYQLIRRTATNDFEVIDSRGKTEVINVDRFKKYHQRSTELMPSHGETPQEDPTTPPTTTTITPIVDETPIQLQELPTPIEESSENPASSFDVPEPEREIEQELQPLRRSSRVRRPVDLNYTYIPVNSVFELFGNYFPSLF